MFFSAPYSPVTRRFIAPPPPSVLLAAVLFGVVWSITEKECLPGGNLFGVTTLFICALIGGKLVSLIHLPRLPPFPPLLGKTPSFALYFKSLTC